MMRKKPSKGVKARGVKTPDQPQESGNRDAIGEWLNPVSQSPRGSKASTGSPVAFRGIGKAYVFPGLADIGAGGARGLSRQFRAIMEAAGIVERIVAADGKKGRCRSNKGFHGLRHTFVSMLANSGVASELRQRLVGHSDSGTHRKYTHLEFQPYRDAIAKLPSILAGPARPLSA